MKISIEIEKGGEGKEGEGEGMKPEMAGMVTPFQRKVAKMLAKAAGRTTPNEVDMETAKDFEEDNAEAEMMAKGMKK